MAKKKKSKKSKKMDPETSPESVEETSEVDDEQDVEDTAAEMSKEKGTKDKAEQKKDPEEAIARVVVDTDGEMLALVYTGKVGGAIYTRHGIPNLEEAEKVAGYLGIPWDAVEIDKGIK